MLRNRDFARCGASCRLRREPRLAKNFSFSAKDKNLAIFVPFRYNKGNMKKNVMKLNKNLKAILCLCLALLFSFSAVFFAGCDKNKGNTGGGSESGGGEIQRTFFENYVSGFAAVYANSENGDYSGIQASQDKTSDMLGRIKDGLIFNYGSGNDDTYRYSVNAPFYDSIRMLVTNDNEYAKEQTNLPNRWSWYLNPNLQGNKNITPKEKENEKFSDWIDRITNKSGNESPDDYFTQKYKFDIFAAALQIVLYEIMLGYEPTTLSIDFGNKISLKSNKGLTQEFYIPYYYVTIKSCKNKPSLVGLYLHKEQGEVSSNLTLGNENHTWYLEEYTYENPYIDEEIRLYKESLQQEYLEKSR